MIKIELLKYIILCMAFLNMCVESMAQNPGDLDVDFGVNGMATYDVQNLGLKDGIGMIAVQPDGKLVFVGSISTAFNTDGDLTIGRLNTDGSTDSTFGLNGITVTDLGGSSEGIGNILIREDGKFLCGGGSNQSGQFQFLLVQYNSNGELDTDFGLNGTVFTDVGITGSTMLSMVKTSDGSIFSTGSASGKIPIVKYGSNGVLDNGFGNSGIVLTDIGEIETGSDILIQDDGKILIIGTTAISGNPEDAIVCRFNSDGSLDTDFNGTGWVNLALSQSIDRPTGILLLTDGRILVIGFAANDLLGIEMFALRLMPDGSFDTTFGTDGVARYDIGDGDDAATDVLLQPDGKALIGGRANNGNDNDLCVIRINEDGSLDDSFGSNGVVITDVAADYDEIISMVLQPDGKLIVGGSARIGNFFNEDIVLARYHTGINTSVVEIGKEEALHVFPNPATNVLRISAEKTITHIRLFNALGSSVLSKTVNTANPNLDISALSNGMYLLQISCENEVHYRKVMKE